MITPYIVHTLCTVIMHVCNNVIYLRLKGDNSNTKGLKVKNAFSLAHQRLNKIKLISHYNIYIHDSMLNAKEYAYIPLFYNACNMRGICSEHHNLN